MATLLDMASEIEQQLCPNIMGSLAVGRSKVLVGAAHGALVTVLKQPGSIVRRKAPYFVVPPLSSLARDHQSSSIQSNSRQWLIDEVVGTVLQRQSLVIRMADRDQLSAFLRNVAHHPRVTTSHQDGLIYIDQSMTVADCLQELGIQVAYACPVTRLSRDQLQTVLGSLECLILLEGLFWTAEDLQTMRAHLPNCTIVVGIQQGLEGEVSDLSPNWVRINPSTAGEDEIAGQNGPSLKQQASLEQQLFTLAHQRLGSSHGLLKIVRRLVASGTELTVIQQLLDKSDPKFSLLEYVLAPLGTPERWILAVLLALGHGVSLTAEQIAMITGPLNPESTLQLLLNRDLLVRLGDRYATTVVVAEVLGANFKLQPWMKRVVDYVLPWADTHQYDVEVMVQELPLLLYTLKWAVGEGAWAEVLRLARSLDPTLVLMSRWDCWRQVLQFALQAAQHLGDRSSEAWAWHQLGTRALCEEDIPTAYDALSRAAQLRKALPDSSAFRLTQHNLNYLLQGTIPRKVLATDPVMAVQQPFDRRRMYFTLALICLVTFGISAGIGLAIQWVLQPESPSVSPTAEDGP
ncbi:hypothetical protein ACN4EG_18140 [Alkalinema pantanalense CENA528]|uniref:hypothetical protein n=1 Tax=Alkalinema pantanalense TaxID=1620705 RepID=UPI003D6E5059